eukprot:GDKK01072289.1.p1 GENE.GDKK01072289.1~~GDKK01072289.1.p1  ORF type:complete len:373 (+),score=87.51 GDKK01072289.1:745-1863(+)
MEAKVMELRAILDSNATEYNHSVRLLQEELTEMKKREELRYKEEVNLREDLNKLRESKAKELENDDHSPLSCANLQKSPASPNNANLRSMLRMSLQSLSPNVSLLRRLLLALSSPAGGILDPSLVELFLMSNASNNQNLIGENSSETESICHQIISKVESSIQSLARERILNQSVSEKSMLAGEGSGSMLNMNSAVLNEVVTHFKLVSPKNAINAVRNAAEDLRCHRESLRRLCNLLALDENLVLLHPAGQAVVEAIEEILFSQTDGDSDKRTAEEEQNLVAFPTTRVRNRQDEMMQSTLLSEARKNVSESRTIRSSNADNILTNSETINLQTLTSTGSDQNMETNGTFMMRKRHHEEHITSGGGIAFNVHW